MDDNSTMQPTTDERGSSRRTRSHSGSRKRLDAFVTSALIAFLGTLLLALLVVTAVGSGPP